MRFIFLLAFYILLLTLLSRQQHLLSVLLCLEGIILLLLPFILLHINYRSINIGPALIILLTIRVSSARTGLALIILISRKIGNDSTINYTITSC